MIEDVKAQGRLIPAEKMTLDEFIDWLQRWVVAEVDHRHLICQIHENWLRHPDAKRTEAYIDRLLAYKKRGLDANQTEILFQRLAALKKWYEEDGPDN